MQRVKLTYFTLRGKYYSDGVVIMDFCSWHTVINRVKRMHMQHEGVERQEGR